jgi:hypothetical protein
MRPSPRRDHRGGGPVGRVTHRGRRAAEQADLQRERGPVLGEGVGARRKIESHPSTPRTAVSVKISPE